MTSNRKKELRRVYRMLRTEVDRDLKRRYDEEIARNLRGLTAYASARGLLVYASMPDEPDTSGIIMQALADGKNVALPKVFGGGVMEFFRITQLQGLHLSSFGVAEPDPEHCERADPEQYGLCVVPGLCFDRDGRRLGYGGGYYDRFLSAYGGASVGLCYSIFIEDDLPHDEHDLPVGLIVTENGTIVPGIRPKY